MTRGRKPSPRTELVNVETDHGALRRDQDAVDQLAVMDQQASEKTVELAKFLGYDGPLQPELLLHGIAQQMRRTVDACLEAGRMLLLLKERVEHGQFEVCLEHISLSPRAAQRFMQAAYKFANASTSTHLKRAIGSESKLIELLVLDDEEVKELSETGSALGISLDDIACMGVRELRAALREAREEAAAKDQLLEAKNAKIDKLITGKKFKPGADAVAKTEEQAKQLQELIEATNAAEVTFMRLAVVVSAIERSDVKAMRERALQSVQYIAQRLADVIDEHAIEGIEIGATLAVKPEWLELLAQKDADQKLAN